MDPARPFLSDGTVVLDGTRIAWVGDTADHLAQDDDQVVDAAHRVVIPGLVNAHYHVDLGKGAGESSNETKPMWDLLFDDWYPFLGQLTEEEAYWATMASYAESVRNGVTTVNDMYVLTPARARAANDLGLRAVLSSEIATPETGIDTVATNVEAFHAVNGGANGDGLARVWLGVEWLPCATPELLTEVRAAATELGTGIHIHLNESMSEVDDALSRFGKRPTELAYELGFLGPDVVAAHCVHLSDAEITMMAETGTHISHNPGSNAYLGNGIARMNDFRAAGINVGMGTDAGFCSDLFEIMRWATYLHRATSRDVTARKSAEALRMATVGGSTALGQDTGVIAAGKLADLTLLDVDSVKFAMMDRTDAGLVEEFVVNHANGSDVATTIVNGEIVMRDRVLTTVDEAEITEGVARSIREANQRFFGGH
ncbi:amidohydrolase family protein [Nakamurella leprariae]|nr:amidohydrolase [Nakamurella leprariae]